MEHTYVFDGAAWLKNRQTEPNDLFYGLQVQDGCTACGLCAAVCPMQALTVQRGAGEKREAFIFSRFPARTAACARHTVLSRSFLSYRILRGKTV